MEETRKIWNNIPEEALLFTSELITGSIPPPFESFVPAEGRGSRLGLGRLASGREIRKGHMMLLHIPRY